MVMEQVIFWVLPLLLIGFWVWMFNEMWNNQEIPNSEPNLIRWPPVAKNQWTIFFVFLSVLTAGYYYFTEYKKKRRF